MSRSILRAWNDCRPWRIDPVRAVAADPDTVVDTVTAADRAVAEAQAQADEILEAARAEAETLRQQAAQSGYEEGRRMAEQTLVEERRRVHELLDQMHAAFVQFCEAQAPALRDAAVLAAERLMRAQLTLEPERVETIAAEALEKLTASKRIVLHVNPEDRALLAESATLGGAGRSGIELFPDPGVERGGCWIESDQGEINATVSDRISRLSLALQDI